MNQVLFDELVPEIIALYETGLPCGDSTGWPTLDRHYTVAMNQWTLITGVPHSGKSEWLDALMVNLAERGPWKFCVFSPENRPLALHASKILEKRIRKPFGIGLTERMTPEERDRGTEWMRGKFIFLKFEEPSLFGVMAEAVQNSAIGTAYKLGVVVDPWNTLEHRYGRDMTLTQYVSEQLSNIINFTGNNYVHFWLVAHPKKPEKDRAGKPPTPYEISDSAHFYNKADSIITIHRDQLAESQRVEVHVQKVRFKHIGHIGMVPLMYDRVTGRYNEPVVAVEDYAERYRGNE